MTPLQMLNGTAAIANGGTLWRPRLVKALVREDGRVVREYEPQELRKLEIDREHIETVRLGMRRTITSGTGTTPITFSEPPIGGKSGTAEYGIAVDGRYKLSHAWFTAFGPFDNPEIAIAVLIVSGDAGSIYAGPVANNILKAYFNID
jgi:penicillin-binding protein 2